MNRINKNKEMSLDELIALYSLPYPNQMIITESQTWVVPKGIKQIKVSGCAAGGAPQAGEYKLDQVIRVREGEVIEITLGKGNTIFGGYFTLIKGTCSENIINSRIGYLAGFEGKVGGKGTYEKSRGGMGGFGGAFGYGGGGGGGYEDRGGDGVGKNFGINVSGVAEKGGDATGSALITTGGKPASGSPSNIVGGGGGGGTLFGSGAGGNSHSHVNGGGGSGGGAGGYGAGGGTGGFNGGYGYYGNAGEGSPGIIIIEY